MWTLFLSIRYFFSKRKEGMISLISIISVAGVALGVASLIIVLSVMNGFDRDVRERIIGTYSHIVIMNEGGISKYKDVIKEVLDFPEVASAAEFITGQAILRKDKIMTGLLIKGINPDRESEVTNIIEYIGSSSGGLKGKTIVLGKELMRNERIAVGDIVEIIVAYSALDMEKVKLEVIGQFSSGRYDYDANFGIVGLDTARKIFRLGNIVTGIGLRVENEMNTEGVKYRLQGLLGYPFIVKSWMDLDKNLVSALALEKKMMFLILGLIVLVACFNISSSLIMMVMEKTRDIGILKAIGANSWGISLVFFLEGILIGMLGILAGGSAGIFIAYRVNEVADYIEKVFGINIFPSDVYYFSKIPVDVSVGDVGSVIIIAVILTVVSGIYPAWKASRLNPVEAIRSE